AAGFLNLPLSPEPLFQRPRGRPSRPYPPVAPSPSALQTGGDAVAIPLLPTPEGRSTHSNDNQQLFSNFEQSPLTNRPFPPESEHRPGTPPVACVPGRLFEETIVSRHEAARALLASESNHG